MAPGSFREDGTSPSDPPAPTATTARPDANSVGEATATREDVADYLSDMIRELQDMARLNGHKALGILLELAYLEARRQTPSVAHDEEREAG